MTSPDDASASSRPSRARTVLVGLRATSTTTILVVLCFVLPLSTAAAALVACELGSLRRVSALDEGDRDLGVGATTIERPARRAIGPMWTFCYRSDDGLRYN